MQKILASCISPQLGNWYNTSPVFLTLAEKFIFNDFQFIQLISRALKGWLGSLLATYICYHTFYLWPLTQGSLFGSGCKYSPALQKITEGVIINSPLPQKGLVSRGISHRRNDDCHFPSHLKKQCMMLPSKLIITGSRSSGPGAR